jgi:hypothetical protein
VDRSGFWFRSVTFAIAFPFFVIALQFSVPRIHTAAEAPKAAAHTPFEKLDSIGAKHQERAIPEGLIYFGAVAPQ